MDMDIAVPIILYSWPGSRLLLHNLFIIALAYFCLSCLYVSQRVFYPILADLGSQNLHYLKYSGSISAAR